MQYLDAISKMTMILVRFQGKPFSIIVIQVYAPTTDAKECSNYCTIALISQASKVMLKILQARFQQHVNQELPDVQA